MTAAELEAAYKQSSAQAESAKKAWHDALVRECGFMVGDRVVHSGVRATVESIDAHSATAIYANCRGDSRGQYFTAPLSQCQRIDESGNVLPVRTKE